jgi:stress response protein YsnF
VEKQAVEHDERVSMPLTRERAEVKRVIIDRPVDGPLPVRREGDTIIMPVVEEVAVVEKRMVLKEEIHVTRRRTTEQHDETVTLLREEADVRRTDPSGRPVTATAAREEGTLPSEERSLLDPSKPRPSLLGSQPKTSTTRRKSILKKD